MAAPRLVFVKPASCSLRRSASLRCLLTLLISASPSFQAPARSSTATSDYTALWGTYGLDSMARTYSSPHLPRARRHRHP